MDLTDPLQQAALLMARARRNVERGEATLRQWQDSRRAFINSLRHTGLTYAQARLKFDNCMDEQRQAHQLALAQLDYAERHYALLTQQAEAEAAQTEQAR